MGTIQHNMILSASGWRKVFAQSGNEQDKTCKIGTENYAIAICAAEAFCEYLEKKNPQPKIVVASDTRPTGTKILEATLKALKANNARAIFLGVAAAPEIMAYAKRFDGFIYISASHNPIGHNGIKFGLSDGGVLNAEENNAVKEIFLKKLNSVFDEREFLERYKKIDISEIIERRQSEKQNALTAYEDFSEEVISSANEKSARADFFKRLDSILKNSGIGVACDFNGSARAACIDKSFFEKHNINFYAINDVAGNIAHEIIPEPENLVFVQKYLQELHSSGKTDAVIGYMCDCDGDRGNLVYWSEKDKCAKILKAQEVFSLSVLAELAFMRWSGCADKIAVAVNCPTSMRIEKIAAAFGAKVFRAEVGEANVVNLARSLREQGYTVRILGEGSNGGTITYPASVRDPLNTVFALIKLICIKDSLGSDGKIKSGLFHLWREKCGRRDFHGATYSEDFSIDDIIDSLPVYTTTGVSESRAILKIKTADHAVLKKNFQAEFEKSFSEDSEDLVKKYNITSWKAAVTNGIKETLDAKDFSLSGKGGLKILFYENNSAEPSSFIWMRGSGTEPVFRIMCDVKGDEPQKERELLEWETKLLLKADRQ